MTAPSQVALNFSGLPEDHMGSVSSLWVLQSMLLDVYLTTDKPVVCRGRAGRKGTEDMAGSYPQEDERLPHGVDMHYIKLYLLSAKRSVKCFWPVVLVALSCKNML